MTSVGFMSEKIKIDLKCRTCKYHDSYSWACCNADSSYVADFTDDEDWCSHYEAADDKDERGVELQT